MVDARARGKLARSDDFVRRPHARVPPDAGRGRAVKCSIVDVHTRFLEVGCAVLLTLALGGCGDDDASAPTTTGPSTPTAVTTSGGPFLRIANLSADLAGAEIRLDSTVFRPALGYPQVTRYRRVDPGSHRVRFVPSGKTPIDERTVQLDTPFDIGPGEAITIIAAGLVDTRTLRVVAIRDDLSVSGGNARIRLINAMSDFPAPLDLWLNENTPLLRRAEFLEETPYRNVDPGNYPLEVRRSGTPGPLLPVVPQGLAGNATYTMLAFGTLRQGDLDARLVLDASQGNATLRR